MAGQGVVLMSSLTPHLSPFTVLLENAGIAAIPIPLFLTAAGWKWFLLGGLFLAMTPWFSQSGDGSPSLQLRGAASWNGVSCASASQDIRGSADTSAFSWGAPGREITLTSCVWVQQSLNILLCASVWCFVWWVTLQSCCLGSASQKVPVSSPKLLWRRWHSRDLVLNSSVGWNNVVSCRLMDLLQPLPAIPLQLVLLLLSKQSFYSSLPPELFFFFLIVGRFFAVSLTSELLYSEFAVQCLQAKMTKNT